MSSLAVALQHLPTTGLFDLSHLAALTISGDNAKTFLQGQLTCNLNDINPRQSRLAAYCNIKGRVVALFRIVQIDSTYQLVMEKNLIDVVAKTLRKYAVFSRVGVENSTKISQFIGILDEQALSTYPAATPIDYPQGVDEAISTDTYTLYRAPGTTPRWEMLLHSDAPVIASDILQPTCCWQAYNVLCGLPTLSLQTSEQFTPHRLGLVQLNAVSFNKGCYLGQEIVARTQYLGTSKGGLYWASVATGSEYPPNTQIVDQNAQHIGNIINCARISSDFTLILAVLNQNISAESVLSVADNSTPLVFDFNQEFARS
jgi:folate-binding protein YgfZ